MLLVVDEAAKEEEVLGLAKLCVKTVDPVCESGSPRKQQMSRGMVLRMSQRIAVLSKETLSTLSRLHGKMRMIGASWACQD